MRAASGSICADYVLRRGSRMSISALLLYAAGLYVTAGVVFGLAFVAYGVTRVLEHGAKVSAGARLLLFPASAALWPLVLRRWLSTPRR
jgi:hypothetical protein